MASLSVRGRRFEYDDAGAGPRAVLLVHGHPFNRSMWAPQLQAIAAAGWRAVAPDLRGYGGSQRTTGKTTLDLFADDLLAIVEQLGIDRFVVAGLSMGGQIAMEICRSDPGRVSGLVLAATSPRPETPEGKVARNSMAGRLLAEGMVPYAQEVLPKMLAPQTIAADPELAARVLSMMQRTDPEGAAAALRGRAERPGYEATLAALDIPALVVVGDADAFTTREEAEEMRTLLRRSELVWMEGVGHMPNLEAAADFNTALLAFLAAIPAEQ